jgi:cation transport regulator
MPYASNADLPPGVRNSLPEGGQSIYRSAFNSALEGGASEESAARIAWSAVKKSYKKVGEKWVAKEASEILAEESVKAVIGHLHGETKTTVQTYIFSPASAWTVEKARAWLNDHGARSGDIRKTEDSFRVPPGGTPQDDGRAFLSTRSEGVVSGGQLVWPLNCA